MGARLVYQAVVCDVALLSKVGDRRRASTPRLRASHRIFGSVSWLKETCLAVGSKQRGASGGSSDSASGHVVDVLVVMLERDLSLVPVVMKRQARHHEWCGGRR